MKQAALLLTFALLLTGCAAEQPALTTDVPAMAVTTAPIAPTTHPTEQTAPPTEPTTQPTEATTLPPEPTEPAPMYAGAVEDFLQPLESFSQAREYEAEFVMIHFTSAVAVDRNDPFSMEKIRKIFVDYGVSIHYIIDRDGTVYCYVPETLVAWHAGKGSFAGIENRMNHYAIGIELVGMGDRNDMMIYMTGEAYDALPEEYKYFTDAQYQALIPLVADICARNGIPADRQHILGHSEYNPAKTDPGGNFDWERLLAGLTD